MKILLDAHMLGQKETGNGRYWKNLILHLAKFIDSKNIILYCNLPKNQLPKEFQKFIIFTPKFKNGFYRIFFGFNEAIKKYKPDLIHIQNFTPWKKTIPIVNTVHDLCFKTYSQTFGLKSKIAFQLFFSRSLKLSNMIVVPSFFVKKMLLKYYPFLDKNKVVVTYEAADSVFKYIGNKNKVKNYLSKKFNITSDFFLVVGEIQLRKQPLKIISAFKKILKKYPHTLLIFTGPNKINLKEEKNIKIFNYVSDEDLNYLYNGAKALIYFSLCEGFGLPIIEAMATKTPVICSNIPVFREITNNQAIFVNNTKELVPAMKNFLENKDLKQRFSLLGYQRSKFFSWEKTAKKTSEIYQWVFQTKNSPITK
ncbi:MAG: glycosyltransferase family 4 protein [Microgenomates group bacterium]